MQFGAQRFCHVVLGLLAGASAVAMAMSALWLGIAVFFAMPEPSPTGVAPVRTDVVVHTVATGSVEPRHRVELKSRVSGVVEAVYVEPGDLVAVGDVVARVRGVADPTSVASARSDVRSAGIELQARKRDLDRAQALARQRAIPGGELEQAEIAVRLAGERYRAAADRVDLLGGGDGIGEIRSTLAGRVLAVEVEAGESVVEAGAFGPGTTVVRVADLTDLVFEGHVPETDVALIHEGTAMELDASAVPGRRLSGVVERIAPEGEKIDGAVQFAVRGAVVLEDGLFVRAGSSATARIVVDERRGVLAIDRGAVRVDGDRTLVDLEVSPGRFEPRAVVLGITDGLVVEVVDGLTDADHIRPAPAS